MLFRSAAVKNDQPEVKIMGTGNAKREFMYVDDLSNAINFLLNNYENVEPINVGFGSDITIKELVEIVRVSLGFRGKVIYDSSAPEGQVQKLLDSSKISAMGWTPKVSLTSGIQQTVSWFKKEIAGRNG